MAKKIWNLRRISPENGIGTERHPDNPLSKAVALKTAEEWAAFGWRVWVERDDTRERIFQSDAEAKEFVKKPRQAILVFPPRAKHRFVLRIIHDDGSERRLPLRGVKTLDAARQAASKKGFEPEGSISMSTLDGMLTSFPKSGLLIK